MMTDVRTQKKSNSIKQEHCRSSIIDSNSKSLNIFGFAGLKSPFFDTNNLSVSKGLMGSTSEDDIFRYHSWSKSSTNRRKSLGSAFSFDPNGHSTASSLSPSELGMPCCGPDAEVHCCSNSTSSLHMAPLITAHGSDAQLSKTSNLDDVFPSNDRINQCTSNVKLPYHDVLNVMNSTVAQRALSLNACPFCLRCNNDVAVLIRCKYLYCHHAVHQHCLESLDRPTKANLDALHSTVFATTMPNYVEPLLLGTSAAVVCSATIVFEHVISSAVFLSMQWSSVDGMLDDSDNLVVKFSLANAIVVDGSNSMPRTFKVVPCISGSTIDGHKLSAFNVSLLESTADKVICMHTLSQTHVLALGFRLHGTQTMLTYIQLTVIRQKSPIQLNDHSTIVHNGKLDVNAQSAGRDDSVNGFELKSPHFQPLMPNSSSSASTRQIIPADSYNPVIDIGVRSKLSSLQVVSSARPTDSMPCVDPVQSFGDSNAGLELDLDTLDIGSDISPLTPTHGLQFIEKLKGDAVRLSRTHAGSRYLQQRLDSGDQTIFHLCYDEVVSSGMIGELIMDSFAHFVIERLLVLCTEQQQLLLLAPLEPQLGDICCQKHGSFAIQAFVDYICAQHNGSIAFISNALRPHVGTLITHPSGHFVLLKMLQRFPYNFTVFIDEYISDHCVEVASDHHGLRVFKSALALRCSGQLNNIFKQVSRHALTLIENQYGNYVLQAVLQSCSPSVRTNINVKLQGKYSRLSKQKFSSPVVELILKLSTPPWRTVIIRELIVQPAIKDLILDRYANYVCQAALTLASPQLAREMIIAITPHLHALRENVRFKWNRILQRTQERIERDIIDNVDDKSNSVPSNSLITQ